MIKAVQARVDEFIAAAQKKPADASSQLVILQEGLDANARDFKGSFVSVADAAKELKGKYDSKAPKAEIEAGLAKLKSAAGSMTP